MPQQAQPFVISVMSRDRVGIVHEVASAIRGLQGDIADLRQSVLRGYFTMLLMASFPDGVTADQIRQVISMAGTGDAAPLEVTVQAAEDDTSPTPAISDEHTYVLTVSGPDQLGFVATVSAFCTAHRVNIVDLSSAVAGDIYTMLLLIDVSRSGSIDGLRQTLRDFGQQTGYTVTLQHNDIFKATQEINMR